MEPIIIQINPVFQRIKPLNSIAWYGGVAITEKYYQTTGKITQHEQVQGDRAGESDAWTYFGRPFDVESG